MLVLLVEDDRPMGILLAHTLKAEGFDVVLASSAEEITEGLIELGSIQAAVVDWMLVGESAGPKVVQWLRENHPRIDACILSAAPQGLVNQHGDPGVIVMDKAELPYNLLDWLRMVAA